MANLSEEQKKRALEVMQEYLSAPPNPDGSGTTIEVQTERDNKRNEIINDKLKPLVEGFLHASAVSKKLV